MSSEGPTEPSAAKYVEPRLHFIRRQISRGSTENEEKVTVSQLVRKGEVLADFPASSQLKNKGLLHVLLEAGEHVVFDEENSALVADASGYPLVRTFETDGPDILKISITPVIKLSNNRMQASLVLHPVAADAPLVRNEDLDDLIAEAGIVAGIDHEALANARLRIAGPLDDFEEIPFARGEFPGEGQDAVLRFEVEIGPLAGYLQDDGTIDFRERKIMVAVSEGQHIATKIPAVAGKDGYNVVGENIESKSGKDIRVKVQGDARFLARENRVMATGDGAMSVVPPDTIKVASKVTIAGDVNYTTGNIASENNVVIKGSIQPGFNIEAGGDLEIGGAVSNASVTSDGNIVIKGGITGTSSTISADGDIDLHFIERGTLKSNGVIVIRRQCYYSRVEAAADIRCHRSCTILGGILLAGGNLSVGAVGAENCEAATLGAGIDPGRYVLFKQLQKELAAQQEEIIQALQLLGRGGREKKVRKMEKAADETKQKLLKLNLIPGTDLYSRIGKGKERDDLDEEDPLYLKEVDIENIRIEVHGKMYAGTRILLGNRTAVLSQDVENRRYRLSKNLKRIMAIPL